MPFTNLWDTTQPPDTQLANLLGQDIRSLKLDIQQRMGAQSGTLAARWNPLLDVQPANWTGVLYFATDTNQVFQWSGAAWVDITTLIIGQRPLVVIRDSTAHAHTGTVTEDTIYTVPVAAGALGTVGVFRGSLAFGETARAGVAPVIKIRYGGNLCVSLQPSASFLNPGIVYFEIGNKGVTNSQGTSGIYLQTTATPIVIGTGTITDSTLAQNITVTVQSANAGDSQAFNQFIGEIL
jgi:hypothetical protein